MGSNEIVTNSLLQKNVHRLHKQVFVKVKVADNAPNQPLGAKQVANSTDNVKMKSFANRKSQPAFGKTREPHTSKSFRSTIENRQSLMAKQREL